MKKAKKRPGLPRIPGFLALPGPKGSEAYIITIHQRRAGRIKVGDEPVNATSDSMNRRIELPKRTHRRRKLFLLYHELGHLLEDYRLWLLQELGDPDSK